MVLEKGSVRSKSWTDAGKSNAPEPRLKSSSGLPPPSFRHRRPAASDSMVTYQVSLGRSLAVEPRTRQQKNASSSSSLVSVKCEFTPDKALTPLPLPVDLADDSTIADNFKPPSISSSSPGLLHVEESKGRDNSSNPQWTLEFAGTGQTAHGFSGHQTAAKDVDCVLVWDSKTNVSRAVSNSRAWRETDSVFTIFRRRMSSID